MIDRRSLMSLGSVGLAATALAGPGAANARPAQPDIAPLSAPVRARIDAMLDGKDSAGGVMVATLKGQPVAFHAWGKASLPFDVAPTPDTLFHIGSNGKRFTAWAVLQLIEAGRVAPSDPIGRHVPDLPASISGVTIDQLVHHVSGLADYANLLPDWDRSQPREEIIRVIDAGPQDFPPGARWAYSNTNYVLLGWLIEAVTGKTYTEYLNEKLFKPAGLPHARTDAAQTVIPQRAEPYEFNEGQFLHAVVMENSVSRAPDGGVLFSARDLAPWAAVMFSPVLLSTESASLATQPGRLSTGRRTPYGYGLNPAQRHGRPVLTHTGGVPGFVSEWTIWPQEDLHVLWMSNSEGGAAPKRFQMIEAMAEAIIPGLTRPLPDRNADDSRTQRLRRLLVRPVGEAPAADLMAEELTTWTGREPTSVPRIDAADILAPIDTWPLGDTPEEGTAARYYLKFGARDTTLTVGWTADDRIYGIF